MNRSMFLAACGLALAGCTTDVTLRYTPSVATVPASQPPTIARVTASDERGEDGHYLGTIRGGFGNPIKTVRSGEPASEQVVNIFRDALRQRGLLDASGQAPDMLAVRITRMDVNQVARREARVNFTITVQDRAGTVLYQDAVEASAINGSLITFDAGIFAGTDDLTGLLVSTIGQAVDRALDKPAFRAAISPR